MIVRVSNFDVDVQHNHRPEAKSRGNVSFFYNYSKHLIDCSRKSLPRQPEASARKLTGRIISEPIQPASQPREFVLTVGWLNTWHCRAYSGTCVPIRTRFVLLSAVGNSGRCGIQSGHCLGATRGSPRSRRRQSWTVSLVPATRARVCNVHVRYTRIDAYFRTGHASTPLNIERVLISLLTRRSTVTNDYRR